VVPAITRRSETQRRGLVGAGVRRTYP
jgi:hypothetical protein